MPQINDLTEVMALSDRDRRAVDALIADRLHSDVVLVNSIAEHIIQSGGKRMRPLVHLLIAKALGYQGTDHIQLAAVIEFIHTATLLHDDVVDESARRRGQQTAHQIWGNAPSVLVGDFLYSRSFQMMVELDNPEVMKILANTTNTIAAGEVLQLMQMGNADLSVDDYFRIISDKTACLFAASAELGAVVAQSENPSMDPALRPTMRQFGLALGQCFQITDDVLDYQADDALLGKNIGDDLAEGKVTLPLILALQQGTAPQQAMIRSVIESSNLDQLDAVCNVLTELDALRQAKEQAERLAEEAQSSLDHLPPTLERDALGVLIQHAVYREQ